MYLIFYESYVKYKVKNRFLCISGPHINIIKHKFNKFRVYQETGIYTFLPVNLHKEWSASEKRKFLQLPRVHSSGFIYKVLHKY